MPSLDSSLSYLKMCTIHDQWTVCSIERRSQNGSFSLSWFLLGKDVTGVVPVDGMMTAIYIYVKKKWKQQWLVATPVVATPAADSVRSSTAGKAGGNIRERERKKKGEREREREREREQSPFTPFLNHPHSV